MIPNLRISLLGDFLLLADEISLSASTIPRVQSLLAYLILHRNASVDHSHLAFLLWPNSTEAQAHTNLRQLLYHLRQSLPYAEQFLFINKHSLQSLSWHRQVVILKRVWCGDWMSCGSGVSCANTMEE